MRLSTKVTLSEKAIKKKKKRIPKCRAYPILRKIFQKTTQAMIAALKIDP